MSKPRRSETPKGWGDSLASVRNFPLRFIRKFDNRGKSFIPASSDSTPPSPPSKIPPTPSRSLTSRLTSRLTNRFFWFDTIRFQLARDPLWSLLPVRANRRGFFLSLERLARLPFPLRVLLFFSILAVVWLPGALPLYYALDDSNLVSILTMLLLYLEFILLTQFWDWHVYHQKRTLRRYGLRFTKRNGQRFFQGLGLSLTALLFLFGTQSLLGWVTWQPPPANLPRILSEGLLVSLGVGFAEELLFRGWLLDELRRDYAFTPSLWLSSFLFALLHFIKPLDQVLHTLPQFLGLGVLGLILVWAKYVPGLWPWYRNKHRKRPQGQLAMPIGLHAGLVWGYYIVNVGGLVKYSGSVPEWVTGIGGNPLAGMVGVLCLSGMAIVIRKQARLSNPHRPRRPFT